MIEHIIDSIGSLVAEMLRSPVWTSHVMYRVEEGAKIIFQACYDHFSFAENPVKGRAKPLQLGLL